MRFTIGKLVGSGLAAAVMLMAGVPYESATSNLEGWAKGLGLSSLGEKLTAASDSWALWLGAAVILCIWLAPLMWVRFSVKPSGDAPPLSPANLPEAKSNWRIRSFHSYLKYIGDELAGSANFFREVEDNARNGHLAVWGRKYSAAGAERNPNPLRSIPKEHWDDFCLDEASCLSLDEGSHTKPRSKPTEEHNWNHTFQDLKINDEQAKTLRSDNNNRRWAWVPTTSRQK